MQKKVIHWIAIVALGLITIGIYQPKSHHSDIRIRGFESLAIAEALADHQGFSNPFLPMPTGPSAHIPPLYPAYLAFIMALFGSGVLGAQIIIWSAATLLAVQMMLFPLLAEELGLGFWTGVVAAVAWMMAGIPPSYTWESNYAAVLVIAVSFLMGKSLVAELTTKQIIVCGVLWGLLLLTQPATLLILPAWMLLLFLRKAMSLRKIAVLGLLPLLVVAPWMVRNFLVFHHFVFIRDNVGLELAVSNNACASALFEDNDRSQCFAATHPNENYEEAMKVRQLGEVEYNRQRLAEAKAWILANPDGFARLTAQRFLAFWLPPKSENKGNGIIWRPIVVQAFTLLSLAGLFLLWKSGRAGAYVVALWMVFFPPIYYLVQFMDRYRYPIFWVTFLCGSYFLAEVMRGLFGVRQSEAQADPAA